MSRANTSVFSVFGVVQSGPGLTDRVSTEILTVRFRRRRSMNWSVRGVREQRRCELPADVMVYFTIAMWLWLGSGYTEILK